MNLTLSSDRPDACCSSLKSPPHTIYLSDHKLICSANCPGVDEGEPRGRSGIKPLSDAGGRNDHIYCAGKFHAIAIYASFFSKTLMDTGLTELPFFLLDEPAASLSLI